MSNTLSTGKAISKRTQVIGIGIVASMFFVFGFVSWINATLIPYFKIAMELTNFQSYLVAFAFYIAYFVMAIPSGIILKRVGFKKGIMYGFMMLALGALMFVPAAYVREYPIFLVGLFFIGTGLAILQTAANPYITVVGPIESAAQRMSIMGICNKGAGIIAPLIFAAVILKSSDSQLFDLIDSGTLSVIEKNAILDQLIRRVMVPYAVLGVFLAIMGVAIRYSVLPEIDFDKDDDTAVDTSGSHHIKRNRLIDFPYLIFGAIAIFLHVGTQVVAIDTIINYAAEFDMNMIDARFFPSYTLTMTIIGYIMGIILIPKFVSQTNALIFCTVLGLLLSFGVLFANWDITLFGHTANASIYFLASIGLPNALIYAGIWPLSIHNLGRFTNTGSSLLIMGLSGNAILPLIYGAIADGHTLRAGYWVLIPAFVYLVWFAVHGHTINYWKKPQTLKQS